MKSLLRSLGLLTGLVGVTAAAACAAPAGEDSESGDQAISQAQIDKLLDVNDVSILFPRSSGGALHPAIDAKGNLFGDGSMKNISDFAASKGMPLPDGAEWKVVGLRFDPCAPGLSDSAIAGSPAKKCIMQFRLIAQPFRGTRDLDFAAHLVFNLGLEDKAILGKNPAVLGAMAKLSKIKEASASAGGKTAGIPLGPHPGLQAEQRSNGNTVGALVQDLITSFTQSPSRSIAIMSLANGGPEPWRFVAGSLNATGTWAPIAMPVSPAEQVQEIGFLGNGVFPVGGAVNTAGFFNGGSPSNAIPFQVENPVDRHFFNTDCVSCHTSSALQNGQARAGAGRIAGRHAVPANITGYVAKEHSQDSSWNVRNFGYFGGKATVSGRTVSESVEVVEFMNKDVIANALGFTGTVPNGPGKDCSSVDEDVYRCLRDGEQDCFKTCKAAPTATSTDALPELPIPSGPEADPTSTAEPCAAINANAATSVTISKSGGSTVASLGGNDQLCLSRSVAGSFKSKDGSFTMDCSPTGGCTVSVPDGASDVDSVTLKQTLIGGEARRFKKFLRTDGKAFVSRASGGGVSIACTKDCVIAVATDKALLPATGARINPNE